MRISFVFLFILFKVITSDDESYSIEPFLVQLQKAGFYDLLLDVKEAFGDEVAIEVCLQLYETNDCEKVVKIYMIARNDNQKTVRNLIQQNFIQFDSFYEEFNKFIKKISEVKHEIDEVKKLYEIFYKYINLFESIQKMESIISKVIVKFSCFQANKSD